MKKKIAMFTNVAADAVFSAEDVDCIYEVPIRFHAEGVDEQDRRAAQHLVARARADRLGARRSPAQEPAGGGRDRPGRQVRRSRRVVQEPQRGAHPRRHRQRLPRQPAPHRLRGDREARRGAAAAPTWTASWSRPASAAAASEGKIDAVRYAREQSVPFFGICLGMQMAVIEFARNVVRPRRRELDGVRAGARRTRSSI